ncbi:cycloheximide resistance protein [Drepanopeziza brunnea f. sp. 'multigermtubi' MB_m1]|uniref:Cycloheximide resistance protein n=2 Tax=Drepanopeziza brunnea f. sp. 'multigermtubi' TaxID=698441 RepID=K1WLF5_MARBU|nr:cycloheximide resistance protein [Drepanopeziza brunnea f. sp. 'multigermtubi' MB_m1]EKD13651.1 cycloheximide resistance protein [Drepanopeziza brunnea f. sp. 'multigermtubi' MB_m1]
MSIPQPQQQQQQQQINNIVEKNADASQYTETGQESMARDDASFMKSPIPASEEVGAATAAGMTSKTTNDDDSNLALGNEFIVSWNEPEDQDPENPLNWSSAKKWLNICTIAVISFIVPLVSSILAPGVKLVMAEFDTTSTTFATFVVSIFVLGFASGPLLLAPLSELYGRVVVYHTTNVLFLGFNVMCALSPNQSVLLAARFFAGFTGVATITIGSGTITDLMPKEKRGKAVSIWSVGTISGPAIGPIIGGYVAQGLGWRWIFWVVSIVIGVVAIAAFLILEETYAPVLLERRAAKIRSDTGNAEYRSKLASDLTPRDHFRSSMVRPLTLLVCYPIVTVMCAYVAVLYSLLYLLFSTYSFAFTVVYGFSTAENGLNFLAGGIGTLMGLAYIGKLSDRTLRRRAAAGRELTPEDRLPLIITIPGSLTFPLGLFVYGWSLEYGAHWIVPQIGTAITGFGSIIVFISVQTYLIDAFEAHAASVVGANAVLRGTAGALLPLAGLQIYDELGWGWGNSLLAFLALAFAPLPWILGRYGAKIRHFKYS